MTRRRRWSGPTDYVDRLVAGWRRERPDLDIAPVEVVYRVGRLASYFSDEVDAVFERAGVTSTDFAVLANLRRSGDPYQLTQRELMDSLQLTSGTVSVRIDRLVADGLVQRAADPRDGRSVLVTLLPPGADVFDRVAPLHLANEARLLAALRPEDRAQLSALLRILLIEFEQPTGDRPDDRLGITVSAAHVAQLRREAVGLAPAHGLLVDAVRTPSPAAAAGLMPGDLIQRANGVDLFSLACLTEALIAAPDQIDLAVRRGSRALSITIEPLPPGEAVTPPVRRRTRRS